MNEYIQKYAKLKKQTLEVTSTTKISYGCGGKHF